MFILHLTDIQIRLIFSFCYVQLIRASTGDSVSISVYTPPPSGFGITLLKAEIETVSSKKSTRPGSALELDSLDISKHIISRFADQVNCSYLLSQWLGLFPFFWFLPCRLRDFDFCAFSFAIGTWKILEKNECATALLMNHILVHFWKRIWRQSA